MTYFKVKTPKFTERWQVCTPAIMKTDLGEYVLDTNKVLDVFFDYWV